MDVATTGGNEMHFFAGVVVPPGTTYDDAHKLVEEAMAPYSEDTSRNGWWDWWVIGGRWTGALSEYNPQDDPANYESCFLCSGGGLRNDDLGLQARAANPDYTCNGCSGTGRRLSFRLQPHEGDVAPVAYALNARLPYTVVTPAGVVGTFRYPEDEDDHQRRVREALERYRDQWLVVVDYHS